MNGDLEPIRCSSCSRFLGYHYLVQGMVFIRCPNCKNFNQVISEGFESPLTNAELYDILKPRTKGQKDQPQVKKAKSH